MELAIFIKTPRVDNVILHRPFKEPTGVVLCITSHHLILSSRASQDDELWILHVMIDSVERRQSNLQNSLVIKCKDFRVIQLDIKGQEELRNVAESIDQLANLDDCRLFYPFHYRPMFDIVEDGWQTFQLDREYQKILQSTDDWRVSQANKDYKLCSTYPESIVVPKSINDECLSKVAQFRCLGRFPVLSYLHKPNRAVIVRSGQPMVGPGNKRCKDDEKLMNTIIGNKRGYIIDTRTQNIAQLAKTKGGGHEPETYYPLLRRVHRPIDRYQTLSDSLHKLVEACQDKDCPTDKWLQRLDASNWLKHINDVLTCACLMAQCIDHEGASVLVHGSEGMNSTLQVCSLAQIILDPDCRTVQGFEALIEREWLQAGHPFTTRCKHSAFAPMHADKREFSPVFMLFLDCVSQIMKQFPCSFEFDEDFLILLLDHAYGSEFGTFLGNSPKQRDEFEIHKTTSLWSYVNMPTILQEYLNPLYEPREDAIWPSVAAVSIELWENVFFRWITHPLSLESKRKAKKRLHYVSTKKRELRNVGDKLQKQLDSLTNNPALNNNVVRSNGHTT